MISIAHITFAAIALATSYFSTVPTVSELAAAGGSLLRLLAIAEYTVFAAAHYNRIYYAYFLHIRDYNLVLSFTRIT